MVFEKITIFEPHLEGATLGPTFGESAEPETHDTEEHAEASAHEDDSGGRSRVLSLVLASIVVSLAATVVARRFFGEDDYEVEQVDLEESVDETMEETAE